MSALPFDLAERIKQATHEIANTKPDPKRVMLADILQTAFKGIESHSLSSLGLKTVMVDMYVHGWRYVPVLVDAFFARSNPGFFESGRIVQIGSGFGQYVKHDASQNEMFYKHQRDLDIITNVCRGVEGFLLSLPDFAGNPSLLLELDNRKYYLCMMTSFSINFHEEEIKGGFISTLAPSSTTFL